MKKLMILTLVLLVTLFVAIAPALAQDETDLVELRIVNDTDGEVWISLAGEGVGYYLVVADGTSRSFTVERGAYDMRSGACGMVVDGTFDLSTQVRVRFLPCWGSLSNFGEPTKEVVNLLSPPPQLWRFQFR
jgi:hypothetical protein